MPKGDNNRKLTPIATEHIVRRLKVKGVCQSALARINHVSRQRIAQIKKEYGI